MKLVTKMDFSVLGRFLGQSIAVIVALGTMYLVICGLIYGLFPLISNHMDQVEAHRKSIVYFGELPSDFCKSDAANRVPSGFVPYSFWDNIPADYVLSYFNDGKLIKVFYERDTDNRLIPTNRIELWCVQ